MGRLPKKFAPLAYGIVQAAITTAISTAAAVHQWIGFSPGYLSRYLASWTVAFLMMLPVVVLISPVVKRIVSVFTADEEH
jgi:Protein of unknown function (DUF2798)